ncbi:putative addiction module antidote protein [Granulicella aggregans]|uniref:Putative addiction module antidote protein n=1 Tax=Granulicella aggregans TaxID=474949 RepID=A0A7W8E3R6_9BACT|nr:hypothetical protein [Granulicella aggregans]MBB5057736.1 putative addiction module antidote protein [Granulicella aggregans]
MSKRIKISDLPEFDAAPYLDSEASIAAYLTDILEVGDGALLASALGEIARRGMTEIAKSGGSRGRRCIRRCGRGALRVSIR